MPSCTSTRPRSVSFVCSWTRFASSTCSGFTKPFLTRNSTIGTRGSAIVQLHLNNKHELGGRVLTHILGPKLGSSIVDQIRQPHRRFGFWNLTRVMDGVEKGER